MEDFGVIVYILAAVAYTIYSAVRKKKKKQQGGKQQPQQRKQSSQKRQTQQQQPGKSLDDILKELYPETKQQPKPQPKPQRQVASQSGPDLDKRISEAEELLNNPKKRRVETKKVDPINPVVEISEEKEVPFDLRQAIIAQAILERPYK